MRLDQDRSHANPIPWAWHGARARLPLAPGHRGEEEVLERLRLGRRARGLGEARLQQRMHARRAARAPRQRQVLACSGMRLFRRDAAAGWRRRSARRAPTPGERRPAARRVRRAVGAPACRPGRRTGAARARRAFTRWLPDQEQARPFLHGGLGFGSLAGARPDPRGTAAASGGRPSRPRAAPRPGRRRRRRAAALRGPARQAAPAMPALARSCPRRPRPPPHWRRPPPPGARAARRAPQQPPPRRPPGRPPATARPSLALSVRRQRAPHIALGRLWLKGRGGSHVSRPRRRPRGPPPEPPLPQRPGAGN